MRLRKCYVNGKVHYGNSNFGSNITSQLGSETCQEMSLEPKQLMQKIVDGDIAGIAPYTGGYDEESSDLEGFFTDRMEDLYLSDVYKDHIEERKAQIKAKKVDEPKVDEPKVDEPKVDGPKVDGPKN